MGHPDNSRLANKVLICRTATCRLFIKLDGHLKSIRRRRYSSRHPVRFPVDRAGASHADDMTAQDLGRTKQAGPDAFAWAHSLGIRLVESRLDGQPNRVQNLQGRRSRSDRASGNQRGRPHNSADRRDDPKSLMAGEVVIFTFLPSIQFLEFSFHFAQPGSQPRLLDLDLVNSLPGCYAFLATIRFTHEITLASGGELQSQPGRCLPGHLELISNPFQGILAPSKLEFGRVPFAR